MTLPTIYLHIGQTKTATTTIQAFCHRNRAWLRERGVLYPESPAGHAVRMKHHHLVESLNAGDAPVSAPWREVLGQAEAAGSSAVLVSDEVLWHLHAGHPERRASTLAWLAQQLKGVEVRVICYLRRQDRWVESWFNQQAKGGHAGTARLGFDAFVEHQKAGGLLDYARVLADWAAALGDAALVVRSFERSQLLQGDVLVDFLSQLGLNDLGGAWRPGDRQVALSRPASLLMNRFNQAGASEALRQQLRRALKPVDGEPRDARHLLSPQQAAALLALGAEGNAEVSRRYRGGEALFQDLTVHHAAMHYPTLRPEDEAQLLQSLEHAGVPTALFPPLGTAAPDARPAGPSTAAPGPGEQRPPGSRTENWPGCQRAYIFTVPKAGTYLMSEFLTRLGLASSGWHIAQNKALHTHGLDADTNRSEPSRAMVATSYLSSFRKLPAGQHAFGHFNPLYVPPQVLLDKDYCIIAVRRHPREVLVSEFIDFRHRRRDVDWVSEQRIPDHAEAFLAYLRQHGHVIRNICLNFLLLREASSQLHYLELVGRPRHLFTDFRSFVDPQTGPAEATRIADFLGCRLAASAIEQCHEAALASDNKTKSEGLVLPYPRQALWSDQAEQEYAALGFEHLAAQLAT
jgi:hypothetical protein